MKPLPKRRFFFFCGLVLAGVFGVGASGGCAGRENAVDYKETDAKFLRYPGGNEDSPAAKELKSGSIFPISVGSHWEMQRKQGPLPTDPSKKGEVVMTRQLSEKITVVGQTMVSGQPGTTFESNAVVTDGTPAKPETAQEVYSVTKNGLYLLALSGDLGRMTMSPPLPLVVFPPKEGQPVQWNGVLHYQKATAPASCVSRVTKVETIKTPAVPKGVAAYRVDTIISTTLLENGVPRQVSFPTTRWLAPGIGLVRQKMLSGNELVIKDLKTFEIVKK